MELKPGDRILYVADLGHWHETDRLNMPVFDFVAAVDHSRVKAGEPVDSVVVLKSIDPAAPKHPAGYLMLTNGLVVKPSKAKQPWPGVVREEITLTPRKVKAVVDGKEMDAIVHDENRALVLDVIHPNGFVMLHFSLETLQYDQAGQKPHSYHLPGDA